MLMRIILHNIRSIYNVGSIFRTADAAGVEKIYLYGVTPSPLDRFKNPIQRFIKVSLGAEKTVVWEKIKQINALINKLKKDGFEIITLEQSKKSIPYYELEITSNRLKNLILILGNEVNGLPLAILKNSDKVLEIPMYGEKESLNVAMAFGVVAFGLLAKCYNSSKC